MRKRLSYLLLFCLWVFHDQPFYAQIDITYQTPPEEIARLIDAPATPHVEIGPDKNIMLIIEGPGLPSVEQVAQPELRIAGLRINPGTNGSSRSSYFTAMKVKRVSQDEEKLITGIPDDAVIRNVEWSPDGKKIAFTLTKNDGIELWMASIESLQAKKLTEKIVNDAIGDAYHWFSDSESILYQSISIERGAPPEKKLVPEGPVVSENLGTKAAVRTFQDLLKNRYDEELFDYYTTSQICITDLEGNSKPLGGQGIVKNIMPSPDGKYILVEKIQYPYSYLVPYYRFPSRVEVWDRTGKTVKTVAEIPLSEDIPTGFDAVRKGPRSFTWRADVPATLVWVEALDEGDPSKEAAYRDQVFYLKAPFSEKAVPAVKTQLRFDGIIWGTDEVAVLHESWWSSRRAITSRIKPGQPAADKEVWFDRSFEDAYNDPGNFQTVENIYGRDVLLMEGKNKTLFLTGEGASPEGNRPFLDQFDVAKKSTKRLWQSEAPYYEFIEEIMDPQKRVVLTSRESKEEQPNYYVRELKSGGLTQITTFPHPYPSLKKLSGELIIYTREDGVQLTGKLYLPPGYKKEDGTLPVLMWAYPREFKDASLAGQVTDSPYRFLYIGRYSPVMWVTQGYAVFDDLGMPIIGEGDKEPNDSFVSQLVANGKAAINKLVEMGVADPNRVAVGGHSYGAFMTANLLAHSDLFAAGIARSGAYNRTLTPFGFQSEERTFWEAPEVYFRMSPFMHADKIKAPILLIHGEADNNSGTFPMQSERFYSALKGHGGTVRLVMLPHESHGYRGKESIMHMAWEMNRWLEEYVKNKKE